MNEQPHHVEVPAWLSDRDAKALISKVSRATGKKAQLVTQRYVATESIRLAQSLEILFQIQPNGGSPPKTPQDATTSLLEHARATLAAQEEEEKQKSTPRPAAKPRRGQDIRSWTTEGGVKISSRRLKEMLIKHEIKIGTKLHHPNKGRKEVAADPSDPKAPYILIRQKASA